MKDTLDLDDVWAQALDSLADSALSPQQRAFVQKDLHDHVTHGSDNFLLFGQFVSEFLRGDSRQHQR